MFTLFLVLLSHCIKPPSFIGEWEYPFSSAKGCVPNSGFSCVLGSVMSVFCAFQLHGFRFQVPSRDSGLPGIRVRVPGVPDSGSVGSSGFSGFLEVCPVSGM